MVNNLPAMWEARVRSLGQEDPLEKEIHSSILAWRIPRTEEAGGLQSKGLQRVGHDWTTSTLSYSLVLPDPNVYRREEIRLDAGQVGECMSPKSPQVGSDHENRGQKWLTPHSGLRPLRPPAHPQHILGPFTVGRPHAPPTLSQETQGIR